MRATILHHPRCSKSRATLALLREAGAEVTVVDYLVTPPAAAELVRLLALAGLTPRDVLRRGEGAALAGADDAAVLAAIAAEPALLERPLVETPRGVRLCRPPERVHEIL